MDQLKAEPLDPLQGKFRPEFINRVDEIIVFRPLNQEQLLDITRLLLDRLGRRLRAQRIEVEFSEEAVQLLSREGYDPEFGARPLRRTIQRLVENQLSKLVLDGSVEPGDKVAVDVDGAELRFQVEKGAAPELLREQEEKASEPAGSSA